MNQQKSKLQIKMTTRNYGVVSCKVCRIGYRSSSIDCLMKVFQNIEMLRVLLMNYLWSREQKWYRVNTTSLLTSRKTGIAISVGGRKLRGLLAEDAPVQSCPERTIFGDLITTDHKVLSEGCESRHAVTSKQQIIKFSKQSSIRSRGAGLGHPMNTFIPV